MLFNVPVELAIKLFVFVSAFDILSGYVSAFYNREANSKVSYKGLSRKLGLMIGLGLAYLLDMLVNTGGTEFLSLTFYAIFAMEGLSILENLERMGIELPFLKDRFAKMKEPKKPE